MLPTKWLEENVYGFRDLTRGDRVAIRDFGLLWSLFEAKSLDNYGNADAIVAAMQTLADRGRLDLKRLAPALAYFRDRYVENGELNYHHEGLYLRGKGMKGDKPALVEGVLLGEIDDPVGVAAGVLIIIYRFRNNLHHGLKWVYGIRGQRKNFQHSNAVLMAVMEMWGLNQE